MRILIIGEEPSIADPVETGLRSFLGDDPLEATPARSFDEALRLLKQKPFDLLFLDLDLGGEYGHEALQRSASYPFHVIAISARPEQAARAFELGAVDFLLKPLIPERLKTVFDRCFGLERGRMPARYLTFRKNNRNTLLPVGEVVLLKADRYLVEAWMQDGRREIMERPLNLLQQILPDSFVRIHRSYIVNLDFVDSYEHRGGSRYSIRLKNGEILPLSRGRLAELKKLFGLV